MEKFASEEVPPSVIETIDSICNQKLLQSVSEQLLLLSELEFRKSFLLFTYIGRKKLEEAISVIDAKNILRLKDHPMSNFEMHIWNTYGKRYCDKSDRKMHHDWDSGKTHLYYCHVYLDGSYSFKGPVLETTRTHLQRALGDENVLIVKFDEEPKEISSYPPYAKLAEEGIFVCLRRFCFFVYKDGGKAEKKKGAASSGVKCYFVRMESIAPRDQRDTYLLSNKTVYEARSLFMHLHTVPSMAKYAARWSLKGKKLALGNCAACSTRDVLSKEPFSLIRSNCMGVAAESWMALMDRLLILGDSCANEKEDVKKSMRKLIDIYYDALYSSKSGKLVTVPDELKVEMLPHYMERENKYQSTSVLGLMYALIQDFQAECLSVEENWKLPCFDAEIPEAITNLWDQRCYTRPQSWKEVRKSWGISIMRPLLFIRQLMTTQRAFLDLKKTKKCGFAWRVAGSALCQYHASNQSGSSIACLASVLRDILN